jgi:hypothetical protein
MINAGAATPPTVAGLTAQADSQLAAGHADTAMTLLGRAYAALPRR